MQNIIDLQNINKTYSTGKAKVKALKNVSLSVEKGEFLSIIGASGSGKSTLMNIIGCLDTADSGKYFLLGKNVADISERGLTELRRKSIGFIFQKFNLIPTLDAFENIALPLLYDKTERKEMTKRVNTALKAVGLDSRANHKPSELSGGQQQRVAIARAIVSEPEILLADEPTGNLDSKSAEQIMKILTDLNRKGKTIVLITHDQKTASFSNRKIKVADGEVIF